MRRGEENMVGSPTLFSMGSNLSDLSGGSITLGWQGGGEGGGEGGGGAGGGGRGEKGGGGVVSHNLYAGGVTPVVPGGEQGGAEVVDEVDHLHLLLHHHLSWTPTFVSPSPSLAVRLLSKRQKSLRSSSQPWGH